MPDRFKICTTCAHVWETRQSFLADPAVELVGYQANCVILTEGLFLFSHLAPDCLTTLGLPARVFADLYDGPIFAERLRNTPACAGHCLHQDDLDPCPNRCECAFVREIIQVVKSWPKR